MSYGPYRAAGREMIALLKTLEWASVVEKASIDEAYLLYSGQMHAGSLGAANGPQLAAEVRAKSESPSRCAPPL